MGGATSYPGGFPNGVEINGVSILQAYTGKVFYVDSNTGSDNSNGRTWKKPVATLNKAMDLVTASKGDIVLVMPGHVENLGDTSTTGAIDLDVAGVNILGIGRGTLQPRIDFDHADSDFIIGANNISIENINFHADAPDVALGVAIEAGVTNTLIKNCKFDVETAGTDEFTVAVNLLAGCDYTVVEGCTIDADLGAATDGVKLTGASYGVAVKGNTIKGDFSTACITSDTTLSEDIMIEGNMLIQGQTDALNAVMVIEMLTGTTGIIRDNYIVCDVATHVLMVQTDGCSCFNNLSIDGVGRALTAEYFSATVVADADG